MTPAKRESMSCNCRVWYDYVLVRSLWRTKHGEPKNVTGLVRNWVSQMPTDFHNDYFAARPIGKLAISVVAEALTTIKSFRYTTLLFGASVTHSGQQFVVFWVILWQCRRIRCRCYYSRPYVVTGRSNVFSCDFKKKYLLLFIYFCVLLRLFLTITARLHIRQTTS